MRRTVCRVAATVAVAVVGFCAAPIARAAAPTTLFTVDDKRLDELSGIARGIASPDVFYVQNDSGDSARFFALDASSGRVLAQYRVPGAQNVDWEDLAVAPDAAGTPSVWLADIGDNDGVRDSVTLYRVDEPTVRASTAPIDTGRPDVWRLRYPGGAVNAESLAVSPMGRAYVVSKNPDGHASMFAVPATPSATPRTMQRIGAITLRARASLVPADLQREATGASLSPDGTRFVVRTYPDAYLWTVVDGDLAAAVRRRPSHIALPLQPQGEGICFDGARLVIDSEQVGSAVLAVPLPASAPTAPASAASSPSSSSSSSSSSSLSATPTTTATGVPQQPAPSVDSSTAPTGSSDGRPSIAVRVGIAVLIAVGVAVLFVRRRRRRQG